MAAAAVRRMVVRAPDLLVAELRFHHLQLDPAGEGLRPVGSATPIVVMHLPPQHVAEEVFAEDETPRLPAKSLTAGWSRVAFRIPPTVGLVPIRLEALLELLRSCELEVPEAALPRSEDRSPPQGLFALILSAFPLFWPSGPELRVPAATETALELPFRLILSPPRAVGFDHRTIPVDRGGAVELWHSQLGTAPGTVGGPDAPERTVRAIWLRGTDKHEWEPDAPGRTLSDDDYPFLTTLNANQRHQIVHLSANFRARSATTPAPIYPRAIPVRRLALTSLGATLDLRGEWEPPKGLSVAEWAHRAAVGRDYFVRVVEEGWLFPFGHRASAVTIHERRIDDGERHHAALIRSRTFIVVREPLREYAVETAATPQLGRRMPLRHVSVRTLITPDLDVRVDGKGAATEKSFEIVDKTNSPVPFHLVGVDAGGRCVEFRTPLWFVKQEDANAGDVDTAVKRFGSTPVPLVGAEGGVPLDLDPTDPTDPDDKLAGSSVWNVRAITWTGVPSKPVAGAKPQPPFHPQATSISLRLPTVEVIEGAPKATLVAYHERYVDHGLSAAQNPGAVVAEIKDAVGLDFSGKGDRAGGLVRPDMRLAGLSHTLGPVAGSALDNIAKGGFHPSDFFAGASPKLFGTIPLEKILKSTDLFEGAAGTPRAPRLLREDGVVRLTWEPVLQNYPTKDEDALFLKKAASSLKLEVTAPVAETTEGALIHCSLQSFALRLLPDLKCIELHFGHATFETRAGKPDVDVRLDEITFVGALAFVEELRKIIPLDAFSDPPALDVTPRGVDATLSLGVPSVTLGIFSLENISFGAGFLVPFDQRALAVRLNFCRRHEPFLLTVSALGGGGFLLIEIDGEGVQRLEAALEFGASLSMDFGVASGGVHVMAGIYFAYDTTDGTRLTGYFRVGGNVSALGIVSVSIELYLALSYEPPTEKAVGIATLTIEIEVFLFSASVELRCERKFSGSASDPTFKEIMWEYCDDEPGVEQTPIGLELRAGTWPWAEYWEAYA